MQLPHIPILRFGRSYVSLQTSEVADHRTGRPLARLSVANSGLIRRDLRCAGRAAQALRALPAAEIWRRCASAGELFMAGELPLGEGCVQTSDQYVQTLSSTSGLPHNLCRRNMQKISYVLTHMDEILRGLSGGIDNSNIFDTGRGALHGVPVSYFPVADALGVVLPSNSPGVNSIWLPAIGLKTPVVLKPGREEPWTPWRIVQALIAAGIPAEAFGFYPAEHDGADAILQDCTRAIMFGDDATLRRHAHDPTIQTHGTGRSKVVLGEDLADCWPDFLDTLLASIVENGGRSCINASTIIVPRHGDAIAEALGKRLAAIEPRAADDDRAVLSAFANAGFARHIDEVIEGGLTANGARDVTGEHRRGPRLVELDGAVYLRPTLVRCPNLDHPLGNAEFLFPFAGVVEMPQEDVLDRIGPTLVLTAITKDRAFIEELLASPAIDRLNLGAIPTTRVEWDQPHEGNLFEFLYRRRAIQSQEQWPEAATQTPAAT